MESGMKMRRGRCLLMAGLVAEGTYTLVDLLSGLLYDSCGLRAQATSKSTAIG